MVEDVSQSGAGHLISPEALAHVPGFVAGASGVQIAPLPGGSVNRSYSVRTKAGRFVLRWSPQPDAWLAADRSVELELHGIAASVGLAPRIVYADAEHRWLITEFIEGAVWTDAHFADADSLARLGDTLLSLHALPAPAAGRFDLLQALEDYARRLRLAGEPARVAPSVYVKEAADAWQLCGAADREAAIVHHDLHGSNLIDGPGRLVLVDWECATVNDPLLDVACVLSYFDSARPYAHVLLEHAGLESVTERQLAAAVWLFDLHTWFWYRERRTRFAPTAAEITAENRLAAAVDKGIPWGL